MQCKRLVFKISFLLQNVLLNWKIVFMEQSLFYRLFASLQLSGFVCKPPWLFSTVSIHRLFSPSLILQIPSSYISLF